MVFKTAERLSQSLNEGHRHQLADGAMPLRQRRDVQNTHAGHARTARILIPVTENLQGGTDRQERAAGVEGARQA